MTIKVSNNLKLCRLSFLKRQFARTNSINRIEFSLLRNLSMVFSRDLEMQKLPPAPEPNPEICGTCRDPHVHHDNEGIKLLIFKYSISRSTYIFLPEM